MNFRNNKPTAGVPNNIRLRSLFAGVVALSAMTGSGVAMNYGLYKGVEAVVDTVKSIASQPSQSKAPAPELVSK